MPARAAGDRDALILASAKVALPPPVDSTGGLPDPASEGARLVSRYCTACHAVPTPAIHAAADWPRVARRMWLRIEGLPDGFDVPRPSEAERTLLLRYLISHALPVSGAALPPGPGRADFVAVCSRCHELPDPASASAEEWPLLVARMGDRMAAMLGTGLPAEQQAAIGGYLAATVSARPSSR